MALAFDSTNAFAPAQPKKQQFPVQQQNGGTPAPSTLMLPEVQGDVLKKLAMTTPATGGATPAIAPPTVPQLPSLDMPSILPPPAIAPAFMPTDTATPAFMPPAVAPPAIAPPMNVAEPQGFRPITPPPPIVMPPLPPDIGGGGGGLQPDNPVVQPFLPPPEPPTGGGGGQPPIVPPVDPNMPPPIQPNVPEPGGLPIPITPPLLPPTGEPPVPPVVPPDIGGYKPITPPPPIAQPEQPPVPQGLQAVFEYFKKNLENEANQRKAAAITDAQSRGVYYGTPLTTSEGNIDTAFLHAQGSLEAAMYESERQNELQRLGIAAGLIPAMTNPNAPTDMSSIYAALGRVFGPALGNSQGSLTMDDLLRALGISNTWSTPTPLSP